MAYDNGGIMWDGPPDPERGIYYPIRSCKPGHDVRGVVLCEVVYGVVTHWEPDENVKGGGRTVPCMGKACWCRTAKPKPEDRWKGYVSMWDHSSGRLFLAEITRESYLRCGSFELYKGQLRGKYLKLVRAGEKKNSRVNAVVSVWQQPLANIPPSFNVQSALERIWFGRWGGPGTSEGAKVDV